MIGRWLYPGEVRGYGDGDLVVAPANWDQAVVLLKEMGFHDYLGPLEHPRMESQAGTGFFAAPRGSISTAPCPVCALHASHHGKDKPHGGPSPLRRITAGD